MEFRNLSYHGTAECGQLFTISCQGDVPGSQSIVKVVAFGLDPLGSAPCCTHSLLEFPSPLLAMPGIAGQPVRSIPRSVFSGRGKEDKNRVPFPGRN